MWPKGVVVTPPGFDEDLGFFQRIEDLPIEKPVAQSRIEALDVAVLPRVLTRFVLKYTLTAQPEPSGCS